MNTERRTRVRRIALTVALAALCAGILAPAQRAFAATFVPISGAGSTWAANAINAWAAAVSQTGMTVNYAPVGSTTGRSEFKNGTVDWAASEIPYGVQDGASFDPPPTRGYAYIPDVGGATAFMYNLTIGGQQVTNLRLSGAVIAGIFTNQITMWNDPKIAADNPGLSMPAIPIVPVVRSDGSGDTWQFTQWMSAAQGASWTAYCAAVGRSPCTATSVYPVLGTAMVAQPGDQGVVGYVSQPQADGAIGYTTYSAALESGFPVAKVLNTAGYYTAPTAGNVGVSLLNAQINMDTSSVLYLTEDLSQVYTDTDPRTYELSYYSYMIVPTDTSFGLSTDKGNTLGAFGEYMLCQGQSQVDEMGYSALPINLVEAGFAQLQKIPGASVPTTTSAILASCNNPTFSADGTNILANTDPMPPACDQQGATQCGPAAVGQSGAIPMAVTATANGAFTLTVDTTDTVTLTVSGNSATAATTPIVVSDSRNTFPGWSVSGQVTDFTGSGTAAGSAISGNQLGWLPTATSLGTGVILGGAVDPAAPGLGTAGAVLALAHAGSGFGTSALGANLTLAIPAVARAGDYTASLTLTAVTALP